MELFRIIFQTTTGRERGRAHACTHIHVHIDIVEEEVRQSYILGTNRVRERVFINISYLRRLMCGEEGQVPMLRKQTLAQNVTGFDNNISIIYYIIVDGQSGGVLCLRFGWLIQY